MKHAGYLISRCDNLTYKFIIEQGLLEGLMQMYVNKHTDTCRTAKANMPFPLSCKQTLLSYFQPSSAAKSPEGMRHAVRSRCSD